jgi:hypothetical protein
LAGFDDADFNQSVMNDDVLVTLGLVSNAELKLELCVFKGNFTIVEEFCFL